jgi:hypothetical protein
VRLYDMLLYLAPSPVTRLHRAIAVRYTAGAGPRWPSWTTWPARSTAITCTTRPAPDCCASWAIPARRTPRTAGPSN